ncbi:MAG: arginine deiminase-related protein, partial [Pseudomonadota bacterium]
MALIRNPDDVRRQVRSIDSDALPVPRGLFLVAPASFRVDPESSVDNRYMDLERAADPDLALRQFQALAEAIAACGVPAVLFPGHRDTPDAVFPNNVFGTAPGRYVVGAMCHSGRRKEAERVDIRRFFDDVLGREAWDLSACECVAELTGSIVVDRSRRVGFCGLSKRADTKGAELMHEAFDLRLTFAFDLRPTEYHTNVVMSVLAGRAL